MLPIVLSHRFKLGRLLTVNVPAMLVLRRVLMCSSVLATLLCAGCVGNVLGGSGPPPNLYTLTPKSTYPDGLPEVASQLAIEESLAFGGLDASRIVLKPKPTEVKYFGGVRWTERAPKMLQTLLIESFENTGKIVSVGREAIGLRSDYSLKTELREFQAEYFGGADTPIVRVRINVKIVRQPRQLIIASRSFERVVRVDQSGMAPIIEAFDNALGTVLKDLVQWTLITIHEQGDARLGNHYELVLRGRNGHG
ncbi:MAG: ABC-type transport auxiliary lipoprotein family protein [Gammaproteobacteria bacterium]|nr:ABC-type transport auxiliary lipoprotein family protein [Gammaproteobacteria bacterium]